MLIRTKFLPIAALVVIASLLPSLCLAQGHEPLPRFGISVSGGTMGVGIQAATSVLRKSNLRFGYNYFSYTGSSTNNDNGITFDGTLKLQSAEILFDQYIAGPFHISPGLSLYYGNKATGNATIPAGNTFTLNNVDYYSSQADPARGTGSFAADKFAPEILIGFGNLLPRSGRHFTFNFDMGVAFVRNPLIKLNLVGSGCTVNATTGCAPIATTPTLLANLQAEQTKLNNDAAAYIKYWPIIRFGIGYSFGHR